MGNIRPLGSEKLNGDDKLKRILELTYYNDGNKGSKKNAEYVTESLNGYVYGIIKEGNDYYVKKGKTEDSLDYIGGLFMKNKNKFKSYAEASKRLNLISGQEALNEATKYVLKKSKTTDDSSIPSPDMEEPLPTDDLGSEEEMPTDDLGSDDELPPAEDLGTEDGLDGEEGGEEESKRSDYMAEAQKYAGKLGQELRDQKDKMESDDIKYVLNMIISAVDLTKLSDEDIDEIGSKFERDEPTNSEEEMPADDEEMPADDEFTSDEEDVDEAMSDIEEFINSNFGEEDEEEDVNEFNLEDYSDLKEYDDDVQEFDLDEIKKEINDNIGKTLSKYFK